MADVVPSQSLSSAAYDEAPYASYSHPQTNPLLLQGIAGLFGLHAPSPSRARILELGCAGGGNILSIAAHYPSSHCIGIDYSLRQIEMGKSTINELGITNLELKHMSIMDITPQFGTFDYIISHGVISWVPEEVRNKILEISRANLAPDGIAFISFNTLPGWNNVRSIRDMLLYHTARFDDPATKVKQARSLLKFMSDNIVDKNSIMALTVAGEIKQLSKDNDSYVLHDHLEETNVAFYFHEFMAMAKEHGLKYVADTKLDSMYSGNLPKAAAEMLGALADNVRSEQYMDFISNRRFRNTLLCHNDRILNLNVNSTALLQGWITSRFNYPDGFHNHDIKSGQTIQVQTKIPGGLNLSSSNPVMLALLQILQELRTKPIHVKTLSGLVQGKLRKADYDFKELGGNTLENTICTYLLRHVFMGAVSFYVEEPPLVTEVTEKPMISALTRYQSKQQDMISNQWQQCLKISPFDQIFMPYVDGTHDISALQQCLLPHFASRQILLDDKPVEDIAILKEKLPPHLARVLQSYADYGLLVG